MNRAAVRARCRPNPSERKSNYRSTRARLGALPVFESGPWLVASIVFPSGYSAADLELGHPFFDEGRLKKYGYKVSNVSIFAMQIFYEYGDQEGEVWMKRMVAISSGSGNLDNCEILTAVRS